MKILATFDGSTSAESILAALTLMAQLESADFTFLSILPQPCAGQEADQGVADRRGYIERIIARMPSGPSYNAEVLIADDAGSAIVRYALQQQPNVIVMSTHGGAGMVHLLVGDVAEEVVRSGVAPVLLVHPEAVRRRAATTGSEAAAPESPADDE